MIADYSSRSKKARSFRFSPVLLAHMSMTLRIFPAFLGFLCALGATTAFGSTTDFPPCTDSSVNCVCDQGGCFDIGAPTAAPSPGTIPPYVTPGCDVNSTTCVCDQGGCFDPGKPSTAAPYPGPSYVPHEDYPASCALPGHTCNCDQGGCTDVTAPVGGYPVVDVSPTPSPSVDYSNCDQGGCH
jgi:hypothetical protein